MINPRTYEQLAGPLAAAGEHVSLIVGQLLKRYWRQLIVDPTDISDVRFTNGVIREAARWNREAREWTEQELALAYIQGLQHTDGELEMISQLSGMKMRKPTRQISPNSPLLPNIPLGELLRFPLPEIFDQFPDHRTFVGVFQRAAHYNLEGIDFQILRASQGLARDAAIQAGDYMFSEGDMFTRVKYAQQMLNEFAETGLQAVQYRNGRTVSVDAYAEMVGRSLTGRCAMQASLNRYQEYGYDLLRVSAHFRACPLCTPWEGRILSHSGQGSYPSLQEAAEAGLFHSNCVAGDTEVLAPGIISAYKRWFEGEVLVITTAGGNELTITPNHPVLTPEGWVPAGLLKKGQKVIKNRDIQRLMNGVNPNDVKIPAPIKDVASSFGEPGAMGTSIVPVSSEDFHGDGANSEVCIIRTDRKLLSKINSFFGKPASKSSFTVANKQLPFLPGLGASAKLPMGPLDAPDSCVRGRGNLASFFRGQPTHVNFSGCGPIRGKRISSLRQPQSDGGFRNANDSGNLNFSSSRFVKGNYFINILRDILSSLFRGGPRSKGGQFDPGSCETFFEGRLPHADSVSDLLTGLAGHIETDSIVNVNRHYFLGHVYNLHTKCNWYIANSIITHNCAHDINPYIPGISEPLEVRMDPAERDLVAEQGYKGAQEVAYLAQQRQRQIERNIRTWKRREAVALDATERAAAHQKVLQWQGAQREHLQDNPYLPRKYVRESITRAH